MMWYTMPNDINHFNSNDEHKIKTEKKYVFMPFVQKSDQPNSQIVMTATTATTTTATIVNVSKWIAATGSYFLWAKMLKTGVEIFISFNQCIRKEMRTKNWRKKKHSHNRHLILSSSSLCLFCTFLFLQWSAGVRRSKLFQLLLHLFFLNIRRNRDNIIIFNTHNILSFQFRHLQQNRRKKILFFYLDNLWSTKMSFSMFENKIHNQIFVFNRIRSGLFHSMVAIYFQIHIRWHFITYTNNDGPPIVQSKQPMKPH